MKTVLVTGSTDGIGKQTALELAHEGYRVIVHGRDHSKLKATIEEIRDRSKNEEVEGVLGDFASLRDVSRISAELCSRLEGLNVLINNAGIWNREFTLSKDGIESTFAVNHLAPFLLTILLLDLITQEKQSRIINVSSMVHASEIDFENLQLTGSYNGSKAYSLSKLCNILFTYKLADDLKETGTTVNCLHPGVIGTKLLHANWSGGAPVSEGAKTPVYLATSPEVAGETGKYFVDRKPAKSAPITYDSDVQKKLWDVSLGFVQYFLSTRGPM